MLFNFYAKSLEPRVVQRKLMNLGTRIRSGEDIYLILVLGLGVARFHVDVKNLVGTGNAFRLRH